VRTSDNDDNDDNDDDVLWKAVPGSGTCIHEGPLTKLVMCLQHDIVRSGR